MWVLQSFVFFPEHFTYIWYDGVMPWAEKSPAATRHLSSIHRHLANWISGLPPFFGGVFWPDARTMPMHVKCNAPPPNLPTLVHSSKKEKKADWIPAGCCSTRLAEAKRKNNNNNNNNTRGMRRGLQEPQGLSIWGKGHLISLLRFFFFFFWLSSPPVPCQRNGKCSSP